MYVNKYLNHLLTKYVIKWHKLTDFRVELRSSKETFCKISTDLPATLYMLNTESMCSQL